METINNATTAVKNAIWGEGEQQNASNTSSSSSHHSGGNLKETHRSMIDDAVTEKTYSGRTESDPMAEDSYNAERDHKEPQPSGTDAQGANFTNVQNTNSNPQSNSNEPNPGFGGSGAQPSVTADPNSAQQNTQKHQGADRPNEEPDSSSTMSGNSGSSGAPSGGMGGMKLPDSNNKSESHGTGEKYVKTTGLHADGGDFDATKPGAAREADRLMDEKGIKHGEANPDGASGAEEGKKEKKWYGVDHSGFGGHGSHSNKTEKPTSLSSTSADQDTSEPTEKKGLGQKIKEKLHH